MRTGEKTDQEINSLLQEAMIFLFNLHASKEGSLTQTEFSECLATLSVVYTDLVAAFMHHQEMDAITMQAFLKETLDALQTQTLLTLHEKNQETKQCPQQQ